MTITRTSLQPWVVVALAVVGAFTWPASAWAQCNCGGGSAVSQGYPAVADGMLFDGQLPAGAQIGQIIESDSIYLTVHVPEKAIIKVNGDPTISVGPTRYFVVKGLEPGRDYKFVIVAETANAAGVPMEETQTVTLKPGTLENVTLKPVKRKKVEPAPVPTPAPPVGDL